MYSTSGTTATADELKDLGNRHFQAQHYEDAISCYNKAIVKNSGTPNYYTNRALCYLLLKQPDRATLDCRKAIELDKWSVKAHFFLGKALAMQESYEEAIKSFMRANEMAKTQKLHYGDEITVCLRQARREKFRKDEEKRVTQEIELQTYLSRLISEDKERKIKELKDGDEPPTKEEIEVVENEASTHLHELNSLLQQVDDRRRMREVPEFLCGKISFELMRDPVITPSGITYDKKDITEHLNRVGHFDPVTRMPLTVDQLVPNYAMKDVIDHFLEQNEWAFDA